MVTPEEVGPKILQEIERCRAAVSDRVRAARELSEKGVMAAGAAIQAIVEHSKAAMADSAETMKGLRQNDSSLASQVAELRSYLIEQDKTVERALGRTSDIAKAGAAIKAMAAASRLLALNARVEAARLEGENRVAFGVIADEMRELSNGVEAANRSIAALARELLEVLPQIRDQAQQMQSYFDKFHSEMESREVEMSSTFSNSMARNEASADQIRKLAYDGLSHLAFQDPMGQGLERISAAMKELHQAVTRDLGTDAAATSEPAVPPEPVKPSAPIELVAAAQPQTAGDVLLF